MVFLYSCSAHCTLSSLFLAFSNLICTSQPGLSVSLNLCTEQVTMNRTRTESLKVGSFRSSRSELPLKCQHSNLSLSPQGPPWSCGRDFFITWRNIHQHFCPPCTLFAKTVELTLNVSGPQLCTSQVVEQSNQWSIDGPNWLIWTDKRVVKLTCGPPVDWIGWIDKHSRHFSEFYRCPGELVAHPLVIRLHMSNGSSLAPWNSYA